MKMPKGWKPTKPDITNVNTSTSLKYGSEVVYWRNDLTTGNINKKIIETQIITNLIICQNNFIRYFAISFVIFLALSFIIILDRHSVVAQTTDKSVDNTNYSINNKTELTKPSWLGLTTIDMSQEISNILQYGEPGILVTDVTPNGPAFKAGIKGGNQSVSINGGHIKIGGDIILTIDNKSLDNIQFKQYYQNRTRGENVILDILRDGKNHVVNLTVGEDPSQIYENHAMFKYPDNINFSDFQNINFSVQIEYPSSWEPSVETNGIYFRSNYDNSSDIARDYLKLNVIPGESNSSELVAFTGIESATTVEPTSPFSTGPYNAHRAIYSYLDPKFGPLKLMKVATIINGTGYLFSYYAEESSFDSYLPTIERMFDTFSAMNIIKEERFDLGIRFKYPSDWTLRGPEALIGTDNRYWSKFDLIDERNNNNLALEISPQYNDTAEAKEVFDQNIKAISGHLKYPIVKLASNLVHYRGDSTYHVKFTQGDPQLGTLFGEQNIKLSNNRIYLLSYSLRQEDYSKTFGIVNQILNSVEPFKILRYENRSSSIIYYYPSDWSKFDEDSDLLINPSDWSKFDEDSDLLINPSRIGALNLYQQPTLEENGSDNAAMSRKNSCDMNFSLSDQPRKSEIRLNTTLGERINASKIISLKNETYQTSFGDNATRQVQEMIVCYNLRGKSYVANYSEITNPGDVSYLSTAEKIIDSSKLMDYTPVPEITTEYNNSDFALKFPPDWGKLESDYGLELYPSIATNDSKIMIGPVIRDNTDINQILSGDLQIQLPNALTGYSSINSTIIKHNNIPGYRIEFQDTGTKYLNMYLISSNNTYPISYQAPMDKYLNYLPEVEYLINSFRPINNTDFKFTGYHVGGLLTGIAVNPNNNMLYVVDSRSNLVHVRDGANNNIIDIPVGKAPEGIAIDPNLNTVYVSNTESNSISIIDGAKNIVNSTIQLGEDPLTADPLTVAVDPITHMVYVGDASTHVLYRIDGISHEVSQIWTGGTNTTNSGVGVAINEITGNVYVANPDTQNVTVVDGKKMKILSNISIFPYDGSPRDIAINSLSNMGYVLTEYRGVYAIDLSTNTTNSPQYIDIPDAFYPSVVTVDRLKNLVYITDYSTNSKIHVLDISNGNNLSNIRVDPYPAYLAVNYGTGITYVSSTAGTVSTIDNDAKQITYGIRYHINSNTSGSVFCNGKKISNNYYTTYLTNEKVACNVNSTNYFSPILSTSWKLDNNSTKQNTAWPSQHLVSFNVTGHDNMNVSMEDINSLIHQWGSIISLATVTSVVVIASIPTIVFRRKAERGQGKYVLERDEILGINASVIVGVLVFLSLEGFNESQQSEITFVTASIVFPFAISVITTILGRNYFATRLMIAGFVNLMISIILIVSLRYRP